jgi:hypothetical protein
MAAIVLGPVLLDLLHGGTRAAFRYLAPDSFYYNTVARNIALHGSVSYDGLRPTNGFHPLWQITLAALYFVLHVLRLPESAFLIGSVLLGAMLVAASVLILGHAMTASGRTLGAAALLGPVGLYAALMLPAWVLLVDVRGLALETQGPFPLFGTAWSFANGMESGLVLLFVALLGKACASDGPPSMRHAASMGGLSLGLALSRLDHVFFAVGFAAVLAARETRGGAHRLYPLALFALCLIGPLAIYLAINQAYSGAAFPVSGAAKTSFPFPNGENLRNVIDVMMLPWRDNRAPSRLYRAAQLVLPGVCAAAFLARNWRPLARRDGLTEFATALAIGTLLLTAYNFLFVPPFAMGHWYTPASIAFVSVALATTVARQPARPGACPLRRSAGRRRVLGRIAAGMASLLIFVAVHRREEYHTLYADFYLVDAPAARAFYGTDSPHMLEFDDGIVTFATGFPTLSGTGLAADREAAAAAADGTLLKLALERGFDRAASLVYFPADEARAGVPAVLLPPMALASARHQLGLPQAQLEFVAPSGRFSVITLRR